MIWPKALKKKNKIMKRLRSSSSSASSSSNNSAAGGLSNSYYSAASTSSSSCENDDTSSLVLRPILDLKPKKRGNEIAIVACGCFWNPQLRFSNMIGVKRVIVGYTGGNDSNPSFHEIGDHTYAILIEYNPKHCSYTDILQMWYDNDYPWERPDLWCHRSALFVTSQYQWEQAYLFCLALEEHRRLTVSLSTCIDTKADDDVTLYVDLEPAGIFYEAEENQQNYMLKQAKAAKTQFILWANDAVPSGLFAIAE